MGPLTISEFRDFLDPAAACRPLPDGQGGTPVNILCRELLSRGTPLTIFTLSRGLEDELILEGPLLRICVIPLRRVCARDLFAVERHQLVAAVHRERPTFIHAHWTYYYALAAQSASVAHVITAHDAPLNVLLRHFIPHRIAHVMMAYRVLTRARRVVSVSPYVALHLRRAMLYRGPSEVIPVGLPEEVFCLRRSRTPPRGATIFASVLTGWDTLKNGAALLEAFARVRRLLPRARLLIMGPGHERGGPAELWARRRGFDRHVEFAGAIAHREVLRRLAGEVDVYVHPSREEACSMAIAEALACGLPVIGGKDSGGVPFSLDDGRAGLLVDLDPVPLANGMLRLATDDDERSRLATCGYDYAYRQFHIRDVATRYLALYRSMLNTGESSREARG
jgi:glycosyltransferase involved in cell wall biosynthesis